MYQTSTMSYQIQQPLLEILSKLLNGGVLLVYEDMITKAVNDPPNRV